MHLAMFQHFHTIFQQAFCLVLLILMDRQPEAVRRSYWARHWACAIDVLELLAVESDFTHDVGNLEHDNVSLMEFAFKLMVEQYRPGEEWALYNGGIVYGTHITHCRAYHPHIYASG